MAVSVGKSSIIASGLIVMLDASQSANYVLSNVEVLVVGGGGGGGGGHPSYDGNGGGGGGGVRYVKSYSVTPGTPITVTVGNGGAGGASASVTGQNGSDGQNSVFGNLIAIGGGGGGSDGALNGRTGGSGGGASTSSGGGTGGSATTGQGFAGGDANNVGGAGPGGGGAGGGGAGGAGAAGGRYKVGGNGGPGVLYSISGQPKWYAAGGGGSSWLSYGGSGGSGIGGNGASRTNPISIPYAASAPVANTGSGGGAATAGYSSTSGAAGVVIVRYPGPQKATGGTITSVEGYTIHTFTSSGTFTPLSAPIGGGTVYGLQNLAGTTLGTMYAANSPTYSTAFGGAVVLNGTNQYLYTTNNNINFNNCTIIYTAKVTSFTNSRNTIFSSYDGTGPQFEWQQTNGFIRSGFRDNGASTQENNAGGGDNQISAGTVYQIAVTYYSGKVTHYKNGLLIGSNTNYTQNNVNPASTVPLNIGRNTAAGLYFLGEVYNFLIYNRELSASEVLEIFNSTRGRFGI